MSNTRLNRPGTFGLLAIVAALCVAAATWQTGAIGQDHSVDGNLQRPASQAKELSRAFRHAAEVAMPTVVTIRSTTKARISPARKPSLRDEDNPLKGTPFERFFGDDLGQFNFKQHMQPQRGMGSGVIIDKSGIVLTNNHVVSGADEVMVQLPDGREFKADEIKTDDQTDLAVLRIKGAGNLPAATLGNSDDLEIGDWVIAIGNPFEFEQTVSAGIISGKGREIGSIRRAKFLQTDAAINPGNSGGPLVNLDGEVVGINTAIASSSGGYQGLGFAIPANTARWVTSQLIKQGSVQRAYLGVGIAPMTGGLAREFGVKKGEGVLVSEVFPNTPAADAGLKEGDVILSFAGTKVDDPRDLQEIVERVPMGAKRPIEVLRDGKRTSFDVVAKAMPNRFGQLAESDENSQDSNEEKYEAPNVGLQVADMDEKVREAYKGHTGVVIRDVEEGSAAAEQGLRPGMLIKEVGRKPVKDVEEFKTAMKNKTLADGILLLVRTPQGNRHVLLED